MQSKSAKAHPNLQVAHSAGWLGPGAPLHPASDGRAPWEVQPMAATSTELQAAEGPGPWGGTAAVLSLPSAHPQSQPTALTELGPIQKFSC